MDSQSSSTERPRPAALPEQLPVLPLENIVIYPYMVVPLQVSGEHSVQLIDEVVQRDKLLALVAQKTPQKDEFDYDNLHRVGTAATILKMVKVPDGTAMILVQGMSRVRLLGSMQLRPYIVARVEQVEEITKSTKKVRALMSNLAVQFEKLVTLVPHLPEELKIAVSNNTDPGRLADLVASNLHLSLEERQKLLEQTDVEQRLETVTKLLNSEVEVQQLGTKIQSQVESEMGKTQRDYYLRQQMKAIQHELGEDDEVTREVKQLREKLDALQLPAPVHEAAGRELDRLAKMPPGAAEYTVARSYIDWILALPWKVETEDHLDIRRARKVLDDDHYDLEKVKERILESVSYTHLTLPTKRIV